VPIEDWVSAARTPEGALTNPAYWDGTLAALGLGPGKVAGIHDDGRMTEAARVRFILQYFGLPAVILNGGWPAVREAGLAGAPAASAPPVLRPGSGPVGLMERATCAGRWTARASSTPAPRPSTGAMPSSPTPTAAPCPGRCCCPMPSSSTARACALRRICTRG